MAEIFLAAAQTPSGVGKLAVLKRIWPELAKDPEFLTMFRDEAQLSGRLQHPNIVQTYGIGEEQGRLYIVMEYIEGQSMSAAVARLNRVQALAPSLHIRILISVLEALEYAHELRDLDGQLLGVVHRDVSPHNVMIDYRGQVKLLDFGIAKTVASMHETRAGTLKGKLAYMAPEQLKESKVDHRADLYAVGVMLWEAIAERRMWKGAAEGSIVRYLLSDRLVDEIPPLPGTPLALQMVCRRALASNPADRYPTAAAFRRDLEGFLGESSDTATASLGELLQTAFAVERGRVRALVQQHLASMEGTGGKAAYDDDFAEVDRIFDSLVGEGLSRPSTRANSPPTGSIPTSTLRNEGASSLGRTPPSVAPPAVTLPNSRGSAASGSHPRLSSHRNMGWGLVVGCVSLAAIVVTWRSRVTGTSLASAHGISAPDSNSDGDAQLRGQRSGWLGAPTLVAPEADMVSLAVKVEPLAAELIVDDLKLVSNTYRGRFARGTSHIVRATAPGCAPMVQEVELWEDLQLAWQLSPLSPAPMPGPAHRKKHEVSPQPEEEPMLKPFKRPKRVIDSEDPYR